LNATKERDQHSMKFGFAAERTPFGGLGGADSKEQFPCGCQSVAILSMMVELTAECSGVGRKKQVGFTQPVVRTALRIVF
jgi:hypothetical protein